MLRRTVLNCCVRTETTDESRRGRERCVQAASGGSGIEGGAEGVARRGAAQRLRKPGAAGGSRQTHDCCSGCRARSGQGRSAALTLDCVIALRRPPGCSAAESGNDDAPWSACRNRLPGGTHFVAAFPTDRERGKTPTAPFARPAVGRRHCFARRNTAGVRLSPSPGPLARVAGHRCCP
jgi:hypothetical protein